MQLRITVVDTRSGRRDDVGVDAADARPLTTVRERLLECVEASDGVLVVDGRRAEDAVLGRPPLVQGCVVEVHPPSWVPASPAGHGLLEVRVVGGPDAGAVFRLGAGRHTIGRADGCDVRIRDPGISREHAEVEVSQSGVRIADLGSTNGTLLDGQRLVGAPAPFAPGAVLEVGSSRVRLELPTGPGLALATIGDGRLGVHRPPRARRAHRPPVVRWPAAPAPREPARLPLVTVALSLVVGAVLVAITRSGGAFLALVLLSPLVLLGQALADRRRARREEGGRRAGRERVLRDAAQALATAAEADRRRRLDELPDLAALALVAEGPGARLWERRPGDDDFGVVTVGTGWLPADVAVDAAGQPDAPDPPHVGPVPVALPLAGLGVLGVTGPRAAAAGLARSLLLQLATLHSPRDVSVSVLAADPDWGGAFGSVGWLPHTWASPDQPCTARVAVHSGQHDPILAGLAGELDRRVAIPPVPSSARHDQAPLHVVVLAGAGRFRAVAAVTRLLTAGERAGLVTVCVEEQASSLPAACRAVVTIAADGSALTFCTPDATDRTGVRADLLAAERAERWARRLAPLLDATPVGDDRVPPVARLLDELSSALVPVSRAAVAAQWCRQPRSTRALLGRCADGPFVVDLATDGPHLLVAGTTGSGKSELLQTLVVSLALVNRPDELAFLLVDYKGGAAFDACATLPHTAGVVTDLDGQLTRRALASLAAELRRRERVLRAAGVADLDTYVRRREKRPDLAPLARLVLVVDEFAALAEELPDFVTGLVAVAQRGRSLGVHLVLATQRPGGAVTADIRANTNTRIALRVTDPAESVDIVGVPDAAAIPVELPGRALARVGERLTSFQVARVTGSSTAVDDRVVVTPAPAASLGRDRTAAPSSMRDARVDVGAVVAAVRDAARHLGIEPLPGPWLPPLPDQVCLDAVIAGGDSVIGYGVCDDPDGQAQPARALDLTAGRHLLVVGGARSGRSTTLRTIAAATARSCTPTRAQLYALDAGGAMLPLAALPHCGAVVPASEPARMARLVERLAAEAARRSALLAQAGLASVEEQRVSGRGTPLPYLMLLVDGWERVAAALEPLDGGAAVECLLRLIRDGSAVGVRAVVAGDRGCLAGRVAALFAERLVLQLADRTDFVLAGVPAARVPARLPPGRGVHAGDLLETQVALLAPDPSGPAQVAALGRLPALAGGPAEAAPLRVEPLPAAVSASALLPRQRSASWALVGAGGDDAGPVGVDLTRDGAGVLVCGPPGSGRSTALAMLAESLHVGGCGVVALAPRRSGLPALLAGSGIRVIEAGEPVTRLAEVDAGTVVVVDDGDALAGSAVESWLCEHLLRAGQGGAGGVILAVGVTHATAGYRGLVAEIRRGGTGLLLHPSGPLDDQVFGHRVPRVDRLVPGRGVLVVAGSCTPIQVARPRCAGGG